MRRGSSQQFTILHMIRLLDHHILIHHHASPHPTRRIGAGNTVEDVLGFAGDAAAAFGVEGLESGDGGAGTGVEGGNVEGGGMGKVVV